MKKVLSILLCFIILSSTVFSSPASGLAVEIVGGGYAAYVILAAALAAAGYTVASNQVSPEVFAGLLAAPGSELINALIGSTQLYANAKGQVFFNWTAAQWATFTNWVNISGVATGAISIPIISDVPVLSTSFNAQFISTYYEKYIPSSDLIIGYIMPGASVNTVIVNNTKRSVEVHLSNCILTSSYSGANFTSDGLSYYFFGSPFYLLGNSPAITIGIGVNSSGYRTTNRDQIVRASGVITASLDYITFDGAKYYLNMLNSGVVQLVNTVTGIKTAITGTVYYPTTYTSLAQYWTDVINSGALVGDFTGIGEDVINPALPETQVSIDAYPDYQVGEGDLSIPDVIDGTIDIPLDRWIDGPIDISQDPVPIDFTDWPEKTIDTTPDDVIPDIRLNPPADVTAPDTPWADEESYPLDYPIDTTSDPLPPGNNPNPDPGQDEKTNRLKLGPLLLSKFPFCLPWDLMHALKVLVAPSEAPAFTVPIVNERLGINTSLTIDLSFADVLAKVCRWFFSALWVVILIMITSKIIWK